MRAERRIADNQLLLMIPRMTSFRRDLDLAVDRDNRDEALKLLGEWPVLASELQGILEQIDAEEHTKLVQDLKQSSKLTGKAKDAIIARNKELVPVTERARGVINEICSQSSKIVGTMKAFSGNIEQ